jgi:uncharacterized FlaG/YvyC family protein
MNDSSLKPISGVRASETGLRARLMSAARTDSIFPREAAATDLERSVKPSEPEKVQEKNLSNIAIHFNVDDETNRLVVVVTERDSGRVLRTIPASEFEKMQAGDLLKMQA